MSNPYIRPNDPRFQREPVVDEQGINRFADPVEAQPVDAEMVDPASAVDAPIAAQPADLPSASSMYASPQFSGRPTYQPEYATGQPSRQRMILGIGGGGLVALACGTVAFLVGSDWGYALLAIAVVIAGVGWHLAADELSVIRQGGLDRRFRPITRLGLALCIVTVLSAVGLLMAELVSDFNILG